MMTRFSGLALLALLAFVPLLGNGGMPSRGGAAPEGARPGAARWGAEYFPNVSLTTQDGRTVHFFDDLLKDKVVAVNFIFTSCKAACPLETARLATVYRILGDRVGRDVFFYSITIDPDHDTPAVLGQYAERFHIGPGWLFLTGSAEDITLLRRKLGVLGEEVRPDGSRDHNLTLLIGNQATGRWMKSSPFENPYVLAAQLGSWLHNWKMADADEQNYANAPQLRQPAPGESIFRTRCAPCHTVGEGDAGPDGSLGPDLLGVTRRRDRAWLSRWLADPEKLLADKDATALALYARYNNVPMPNLRLAPTDIDALLAYLASEDGTAPPDAQAARAREGG